MTMKTISLSSTLAALAACVLASSAAAHGDHDPGQGHQKPPPFAILQLDQVRDATARFADIEVADAEGYKDIGVFMPQMGWHYMKESLLDAKFDPTKPELLVYADDPCGGKRRLVAVEYAIPLSMSKKAPLGFVGRADEWDANQTFQLWTLHAWLFEYNRDGVFAPFNPRLP
jgi:hypothetical protein